MKGKQYLTRPQQYSAVYEEGRSWTNNLLVMKALPNQLTLSRYGFTVSKRIGKAVVRNRVKRLLREIFRNTPLKPGWDLIFIARRPTAAADHAELTAAVKGLLSHAGLKAEEL